MTAPEDRPPDVSGERDFHAATFLVVLIVIAAMIVALQYTSYALLASDETSTLWGVLVGLVLGGFIFRWLRFGPRE